MTETTSPKAGRTALKAAFEQNPLMWRQRIGSTDYLISINLSQRSKETMTDKILRIIEREAV